MTSRKPTAVVIGAGAFGGWTALELLRAGYQVTLVDAWGPGNSRASSGGETRILRATYGAAGIYTRMASDALRLWRENEQRWNKKLFYHAGAIWLAGRDDSFECAGLPVLRDAGVTFEQIPSSECARRWPQINFDGVSWVIYEPDAGYLLARRACEAVYEAFLAQGGDYQQARAVPGAISGKEMRELLLNGERKLDADVYVFACGPWLPKLFSFLSPFMRVTRQEVFFFGTEAGDVRFTDLAMPAWIDGGSPAFYGVPGNQWRGFKIADDTRGPAFDPDGEDRRVSEDALTAARAYMAMRFPGMGGAPLLEARVCQYENTRDADFILDRHPGAENVWLVGGGSGHGFKHGPAVGAMVAAVILGKQSPPDAFSLARSSPDAISRR